MDDPRRCPSCGAVVAQDARFCPACGHDLSAPEAAAGPVLDPAAAPVAPPRPDEGTSPTPPGWMAEAEPVPPVKGTKRWWLFALGGVLALVVVGAIAASVGGDEASPDEAFGLPEIQSDETRALEDALEEIRVGDLTIDVAAYGGDGTIQAIVFTYGNLPDPFSVEGMVRGGAGGIIGSGGSADVDAISAHEIDGVEYLCVPFRGQLVPSTAADTGGVACGWAQGDEAVMLMDTTTTDADVAATHAADVHEASTG